MNRDALQLLFFDVQRTLCGQFYAAALVTDCSYLLHDDGSCYDFARLVPVCNDIAGLRLTWPGPAGPRFGGLTGEKIRWRSWAWTHMASSDRLKCPGLLWSRARWYIIFKATIQSGKLCAASNHSKFSCGTASRSDKEQPVEEEDDELKEVLDLRKIAVQLLQQEQQNRCVLLFFSPFNGDSDLWLQHLKRPLLPVSFSWLLFRQHMRLSWSGQLPSTIFLNMIFIWLFRFCLLKLYNFNSLILITTLKKFF